MTAVPLDLRPWLRTADALLSAVEAAAWSVRRTGKRMHDGGFRARRGARASFALGRILASYRLHQTRAAFVSHERAERMLQRLHRRSAEKFLTLSEELGGAFLKVGQLLSARPDLLPSPWIEVLSTLQDDAPAFDFEDVKQIVEEDLGAPLEALFLELDEEPLAAASIGQVHRGVTRDGLEVAVKVQRPNIAALVDADLDLLAAFAEALESSLPPTDFDTVLRELRQAVRAECDYERERRIGAGVAEFLRTVDGALAPEPVDAYCAARVLTTRFVRAEKITVALDRWSAARDDGDEVAAAKLDETLGRLLRAFLLQVLERGLFQADPHPGNLLVTDDGEVVVLDFGCAQRLDPATRHRYFALVQAFLVGDEDGASALFAELGLATASGDPDTLHAFTSLLLKELRSGMAGGEVRWPSQQELLEEAGRLLRMSEDDPVVRLPPEMVLLLRVFGTLGGLFVAYRPRLDFARHLAAPLARAASV